MRIGRTEVVQGKKEEHAEVLQQKKKLHGMVTKSSFSTKTTTAIITIIAIDIK